MIRWEAPQGAVVCSYCGSEETDISFEFLAFTRHVCRACGEAFYTIAARSTGDRVFGQTRRKTPLTKER